MSEEADKRKVTIQRVTTYNVNHDQREELKHLVMRILGKPATGKVVVNVGGGGVSSVELHESERLTEE